MTTRLMENMPLITVYDFSAGVDVSKLVREGIPRTTKLFDDKSVVVMIGRVA